MKIYLASGFSHRYTLREEADHLQMIGHEIVSRWIWLEDRPERDQKDWDNFAADIASQNLEDLLAAELLIVDSNGIRPTNNGGVHFELGFAYCRARTVLIGAKGCTFHLLP